MTNCTKLLAAMCLWAGSGLWAPTACADGPQGDSDAMVRALLARSRLLDDTSFQVPVEIYQHYLREKSSPALAGSPSPVPCIAEFSQYSLGVDANLKQTLKAQVNIRVFDSAACGNVPVLSSRLAWESVSVNGKPVKLATAWEWLRFVPPSAGQYAIVAVAKLPASASSGGRVGLDVLETVKTFAAFDSPGPWQVRTAVEGPPRKGNVFPEEASDVTITPRLVGSAAKGTHGRLALRRTSRLSIEYEPPGPQSEHPVRYVLRGDVAWNMDAGVQQVAAALRVTVAGRESDRIDLLLPAGADRVSIKGPEVRQVQVSGTRASVFLRGKVLGQTALNLSFELKLGASSQRQLQGLDISEGRWESGTLVVTNTAGDSELLPDSTTGLRELPLTEIPSSALAILPGAPAMAYEITSGQFAATVESLRLGEFALRQSIADLAHYEVFLDRDGSIICRVRYEIRNRSRQFLRLELPAGSEILLAKVNEKSCPVSAVIDGRQGPSAPGRYLLPLERSSASVMGLVSFPVEVVYLQRTDALRPSGTARIPLPAIDLPVAYGWCETFFPPEMKIKKWSGPLKAVQDFSSQTAKSSLDYGFGEMAEGYSQKSRPLVPTSPRPRALTNRGPKDRLLDPASSILLPGESRSTLTGLAGGGGRSSNAEAAKPILAKNYYRAGKDAYDRREFDQAARDLKRVLDLAPGSVEADNARKLLANRDMLAGKYDLKGGSEKAAAVEVQRQLAEANRDIEQAQSELFEQARQDIWKGNADVGRTKLDAAEALNKELADRWGNNADQLARFKANQAKISSLREQTKGYVQSLHEQLDKFRKGKEYDKALAVGQRLRIEEGDSPQLRKELEELAIADTKAQARISLNSHVTGFATDRSLGGATFSTTPTTRPAVPPGENVQYAITLQKADVLASRAKAMIRERKFDEAQQVIDQILKQDANNRWAADSKIMLQQFQVVLKGDSDSDKDIRELLQSDEAQAEIPWYDILKYPKNWRELLAARERPGVGTITESEQGQPDSRTPATVIPKLAFDEVEFQNVITYLRDVSGVSIDVDWDSLTSAGVDKTTPVTLHLKNVTVDKAMRAILNDLTQTTELSFTRGNGIITISTRDVISKRTVTRTYDINDLLIRVPNYASRATSRRDAGNAGGDNEGGGLFGSNDDAGAEGNASTRGEIVEKLADTIRETVEPDSWRGENRGDDTGGVKELDGKLIVTQTPENQKLVADLIDRLRQARGPQVEVGGQIAQQQAGDLNGVLLPTAQPGGVNAEDVADDKELKKFIAGNYGWAVRDDKPGTKTPDGGWTYNGGQASGGGTTHGTGAASQPSDEGSVTVSQLELARKLRMNLGQKVDVSSLNVSATAGDAAALGVKFTRGRNNLTYTVMDEAQFRSLLELSAARSASPRIGQREQQTIVGTDALLSNAMKGNLSYAAERGNSLRVLDNGIDLPHEKYLLIDNGSSLTVVHAGAMQHWKQQAPPAAQFAPVEQTIDVPRAGRLAKFEKSLLEPTDRLVIGAEYTLEGVSK